MLNKWKESLIRKKARRITQEYPAKIETFKTDKIGTVEFANWSNPLFGQFRLDEKMFSSFLTFFQQFIKEGDLAIDIGANVGDTTVPIGLCTGRTGLTIGFDPNPYVFKILQKNSTLNVDKSKIVAVPCAISEQEEEFFFISSEASFSNGGLSKTINSDHGKFIAPNKVKGVNLTRFLEENYSEWLPRFSFIKVDAEGLDGQILKSITDLLAKQKPVIVAECFGKLSNEEKMELYEVISNLSYDIYYIQELDRKAKTARIESKEDMLKWKETINIYALPKK